MKIDWWGVLGLLVCSLSAGIVTGAAAFVFAFLSGWL